jgi:hypothetical protein
MTGKAKPRPVKRPLPAKLRLSLDEIKSRPVREQWLLLRYPAIKIYQAPSSAPRAKAFRR